MLSKKIARERIGTEIAGCLEGPNPALALSLLLELHIFSEVFDIPDNAQLDLGPNFGSSCVDCAHSALALLQTATELHLIEQVPQEVHSARLTAVTALLLPLRWATTPLKRGKVEPLARHLVLHALKWRTKDSDAVVLLHTLIPCLCHTLAKVDGMSDEELDDVKTTAGTRVTLGNTLARLKHLWPLAAAIFPVAHLPCAVPLGGTKAGTDGKDITQRELNVEDMRGMSARLMHVIDRWQLQNCHQWRSLIDGRQIVTKLKLEQPGPLVGKLTAAAREWQYMTPTAPREAGSGTCEPPAELLEHLERQLALLR